MSPSLYDENATYQDDRLESGEVRLISPEYEIEAKRKDGSSFPATVRITEMDHAGDKLFIATIQDVSRRHRAERDRKQIFDAITETVHYLTTASAEISATMES